MNEKITINHTDLRI